MFGKTTIAKEICKQTDNKFALLQIDKIGEFYNIVFPKGYKFVAQDSDIKKDNPLKVLFNDNRLARRKAIASMLLSVAKELLSQEFSIVIDTALDGPDYWI